MNNIQQFLNSEAFGVIGTSNKREKFGNKVLRCYQRNNLLIYPIRPLEKEIEGLKCLQKISQLPKNVKSISIITPPAVTEKLVEEAHLQGIENIWMQPGASSSSAIEKCIEYGINVIANGPCILVELA